MFKNRALKVSVIDNVDATPAPEPRAPRFTQAQLDYAKEMTKLLAISVVLGAVSYVAADTARQVIVKSTPAK